MVYLPVETEQLNRSQVKRTSLLLADDHRLLTDSLVNLLENDFEIVGVAHDGQEMVEMARRYRPDIIVADISMPKLNGIDAARIIRRERPFTKVVFITMYNDGPLAEAALRVGVAGFVPKLSDPDELLIAIRTVTRGECYITPMVAGDVILAWTASQSDKSSHQTTLTPRQLQMVKLIAEGKTMKEAAVIMGISARTAECHKYETMRKLGVKTVARLVQHAISIKLV
jgi:DNA-binding NarL/FixJ family response regulator